MISKSKVILVIGILIGALSSVVAGQLIPLVSGQSVTLQGTTVTCNDGTVTPPTYPGDDLVVYHGQTYKISVNANQHGVVRNLNTGKVYDLGPAIIDVPSAVIYHDELYFFARGTDQSLWFHTLTGNSWEALGGGLSDKARILLVKDEPYMVVRGTDNGIWYRTLSQDWTSLGGQSNEPIIDVYNIESSNFLVRIKGTDGNIWQRTLTEDWSIEP